MYKKLTVWQRSMQLIVAVYQLTSKLPTSEQYGLSSQMRRAAISIPSNIAEGYRRKSRKDYLRFLSIANGSASELETQVEIIKVLPKMKNLDTVKVENLLNEVLKMLNVMIRKLGSRE